MWSSTWLFFCCSSVIKMTRIQFKHEGSSYSKMQIIVCNWSHLSELVKSHVCQQLFFIMIPMIHSWSAPRWPFWKEFDSIMMTGMVVPNFYSSSCTKLCRCECCSFLASKKRGDWGGLIQLPPASMLIRVVTWYLGTFYIICICKYFHTICRNILSTKSI